MDTNSNPAPAPQEPLSNVPQPSPAAPPPSTPLTPPAPSAPIPPVPPVPQAAPAAPTPATIQPNVAPGTVVTGDGGLAPANGAAPGAAFQPTMNPIPANGAPGPSKRRFPKAALISVGVIVALLGASAAAYVGVVVPNQPANQLKTALVNTVKEKQESFKGTLSADQTDGSFAMKLDMDGKYNADKKAADMNTVVTVSGVKLTVDVRFIDGSIYLKTSDLNTIAALASTYSPEAGTLVKTVSSTVSNKWIEVDSTLLNQAGASCVLDSSWTFTDADVDLLTNQYKDNQFATIKSTSSDTVNGASATKFNITVDNKKADKYFNGLKDLSMIKALQKCSAGKELSDQTTDTATDGTTDLTIWVDKATKHVAQIGYETTAADAAKDGTKANLKMSFDYKPVTIDKPADATPVMDIFAQLQTQLGSSGLDLTSLMGAETN